MDFVLIKKLAGLEGIDLYMFIGAVVIVIALVIAIIAYRKKNAKTAQTELPKKQTDRTRALVYGALCVALSFLLSYIKLFSMPFGGSVTLCGMLPIAMYACVFGPAYGFTAAFAYGILQIIQDLYVIHWLQFLLDYFVAFTCIGLASLFPKKLPLGVAVGGFSRMLVSTISGVAFFSEYAFEAGWSNAWAYSIAYNGCTIGVDTVICVIVALLPPVAALSARMAKAK